MVEFTFVGTSIIFFFCFDRFLRSLFSLLPLLIFLFSLFSPRFLFLSPFRPPIPILIVLLIPISDAKLMARDVQTALHEIVQEQGNMNEVEGNEFITKLINTGRYLSDVWS